MKDMGIRNALEEKTMKRLAAMLITATICMAMLFTGAFADPVPEGYPDIIEGLDFCGATVYIYDWWSQDDINHSNRSANPSSDQQRQYDYWDWIESTYNVHVINTALGDWGNQTNLLAAMVGNEDDSTLCIVAVPGGSAGTVLKDNLYMPWTYAADAGNSAAASLMTKNDVCYGRSAEKSTEPRSGVYFNKTILTEAGIDWDDIYDAQKNGTWTWDKMEEYMNRVQRDTDGDGKIDIWGLTGNFDNLTVGLVSSNGGDFFSYNGTGELAPDLSSTATSQALATRRAWAVFRCPEEEGDAWDYYEQKWAEGKAAFRVGAAWEGFGGSEFFNQVEWGFVAMPKGPQMDHYVTVAEENIYGVPNVYDAATALKLEQLYTLWTLPVPGAEEESWIGDKYELTDERAVDETYAMLRESENSVALKYTLLGDPNNVLGSDLLWIIEDEDLSLGQIVAYATNGLQKKCDTYYGKSQESGHVFQLYTPETILAGQPFSVIMDEVDGAHWYGVQVLDMNNTIISEEGTDTAGYHITLCNSGDESLSAGTYRLEYWATDQGHSYFQDPIEITVTGNRPAAPEGAVILSEVTVGTGFVIDASAVEAETYELKITPEGEKEPVYYKTNAEGTWTVSLTESGDYNAECWVKTGGCWSMPKTAVIHASALGTLTAPTVTGKNHFETGETIQFTFHSDGAESYSYTIIGAGRSWGQSGEVDEDGAIELSLSEGGYNMTVYSHKNGWDSGKTEYVFTIGAAPEQPTITLSRDTVYHGESFGITIGLNGADSFVCDVQYDPSDSGSIGGFSGDSTKLEWQWSFEMSGKHFIRAYSRKNGICSAWTTVYVTDLEESAPSNKLSTPEIITRPSTVQVGAAFFVDAEYDERARYSTLMVYKGNKYIGFQNTTGERIVYSRWLNDCEPGTYRATLTSYMQGYEASDPAVFEFTVTAGERPAAPKVTVSSEATATSHRVTFLFDQVYERINVDLYRGNGSRYSGIDDVNTDRFIWPELDEGDWVVQASVCVDGIWSFISETPFTVGEGGSTKDELEIVHYDDSCTYYISDLSTVRDEQGRFSRDSMLIQFRIDAKAYNKLKESIGGEPEWSCETVEGDAEFDMVAMSNGQYANLVFATRPNEACEATVKVHCSWGTLSDETQVTIEAKTLKNGLPEGIQFSFGDTMIIKKGVTLPMVTSFTSFINNWSIEGEDLRHGYYYTPQDAVSDGQFNTPGIYGGYAELNYGNIVCGRSYTIIVTDEDGTLDASLYEPVGSVFTLPDSLTTIESEAFAGTSIRQIDIPETVTSIAEDAFDGCGLVAIYAHNLYVLEWAVDHGFVALVE